MEVITWIDFEKEHLCAGTVFEVKGLPNTEREGTVVLWTAAYALACVAVMGLPLNRTLIPTLQAIAMREEENSIRKIHLDAINTVRKSK